MVQKAKRKAARIERERSTLASSTEEKVELVVVAEKEEDVVVGAEEVVVVVGKNVVVVGGQEVEEDIEEQVDQTDAVQPPEVAVDDEVKPEVEREPSPAPATMQQGSGSNPRLVKFSKAVKQVMAGEMGKREFLKSRAYRIAKKVNPATTCDDEESCEIEIDAADPTLVQMAKEGAY